MLRTFTARAALALAALLVAPACSKEGTVHLEVSQTYTIPTGADYGPTVQAIDLTTKAKAAWDQRDKIKAVRISKVQIQASNVVTTGSPTGSGHAAVRPSGTSGSQDVLAAAFGPITIQNGPWADVAGTDALNTAINNALKGDGQISFVAEAHATAPFSATVTVTIIGDVDYKLSAGL